MLVSAVEEQICVMKKLILLCNRGYFLSLIKNTASSIPKTTLFSRLKTFCQYYQYARCQPHI